MHYGDIISSYQNYSNTALLCFHFYGPIMEIIITKWRQFYFNWSGSSWASFMVPKCLNLSHWNSFSLDKCIQLPNVIKHCQKYFSTSTVFLWLYLSLQIFYYEALSIKDFFLISMRVWEKNNEADTNPMQ